ncbi:AIM24 family protein [Oceanirhabdus seepicola]|uniref:AIM24 family protein n=1 Tax=Oceanirhabdus seepicola TaxID=2828781 RepID=A0A9J6PB21_9CLOT|nr:AIM24 family protein [Oceanirhabdus seepicola]MCM1992825.1 AIM24 family protein [Oceanirhabdus seepicola]
MFNFNVHQELSCIAEGEGHFFAKAGSMVAYKGNFTAEKVLLDTNQNQGLFKSVMNLASRKLTGENIPLMKVSGNGSYYMANRSQHVSIITLQPGQSIGVEGENLLAFTPDCKYGVRFLGSGVISQKGLFTTNLTAIGPDPKVVITTDGNPIVLETPCVVDPDAIICWTGPDPNFRADMNWKTFIGQSSGESYFFEFNNPGEVVIVQPSERAYGGASGINLAID